jgi:hypothetical protein
MPGEKSRMLRAIPFQTPYVQTLAIPDSSTDFSRHASWDLQAMPEGTMAFSLQYKMLLIIWRLNVPSFKNGLKRQKRSNSWIRSLLNF